MTEQSSSSQTTSEKKVKDKKKSAHDKARKMSFSQQLSEYVDHGVNIPDRRIYYPTPSHTAEEDGTVNRGSSRLFIIGMEKLRSWFPGETITVTIDTPGGDEYDGIAVYDTIRDPRYTNRVIMEGKGKVMSMGVFVFQAAHHRIVHRNTRFMIHYGTWGGVEEHSKNFDQAAEENRFLRELYRDVLLSRIREKLPNFSEEDIEPLLRFDHYFSTTRAVEMGLADEIIG